MTDEAKTTTLRILCWIVVTILPIGIICWLARIHSIGILGVALPFILIGERVYRKLLKVYGLWGPGRGAEPAAPPNGGPAQPLGNSGARGGSPSVS